MFPTNTEQGLWVFLNMTKAVMQDIVERMPPCDYRPELNSEGKLRCRCASCLAHDWIDSYDKLYREAQQEDAKRPWPPPNDMNSYQSWASARAAEAPWMTQLAGLSLGAAGEAGEVAGEMLIAFSLMAALNAKAGKLADTAKKIELHGKMFNAEMEERLAAELGDVLWYVAAFADRVLRMPLSEIAERNVAKLNARSKDAKYAANNPLVPSQARCGHTRPADAVGPCKECEGEAKSQAQDTNRP